MIGRKAKEGDRWVTKQTIQTGIDGFRLIAHRVADRTGETIGYEESMWCGPDGVWRDVWLSTEPPAAARVVVLRNGQRYPATVHWSEYVQTYKDKANNIIPTSMWERMPAGQLSKCAEAAALRKAFPQDLSGIYTEEEMPTPGDPAPRKVVQQPVTVAEITRAPEADPVVVAADDAADRGGSAGDVAGAALGAHADELAERAEDEGK
jgi:phage recombination protein Bet